MAKAVSRDDLGYLGEEYQGFLVKALIEDQSFFVKINGILDQNMFTNPNFKRIVGLMKDRYNSTEAVATYKDLEFMIKSSVSNAIDVNTMCSMLDKINNSEWTTSIEVIQDISSNFFKQQNMIKAMNKAQEIIKQGKVNQYPDIEEAIKKAIDLNDTDDMSFRLFESLESDLRDDYRKTIPTGADMLDEALYGGLGRGELGIVIAPLGTGKAQPLTSKVLTPSGYKLMGDITIGDMVIGQDGKPHMVTGVFPQGIRPVYRVDFSGGRSVECDIDHLWNVNTYRQRRRKTYVKGSYNNGKYKKKYNPDLSYKTLSLREMIDIGVHKVYKNGNKTPMFRVPMVDPVEFDYQDIPVDPYLLGYYIGDGSYSNGVITVGNDDFEDTNNILSNILKEDLSVSYQENKNIWSIGIKGETRKKLNELVGVESTSSNKVIPEIYLDNSIEVRMAILQGLMDSDGYADKRGLIQFTSKSKKLSEQVDYIVKSLGGYLSITEKDISYFNKKYEKRVDCGKSYTVTMSFTNENIIPFRLCRKLERVKYCKKYASQMYITNIEYVRDDYTQCIMVDSEDHLYVTDDFIVTHNTSITTGFAANAALTKSDANNDKGYKVLHFFFEDVPVNIRRKYYGFCTGIDAYLLSDPQYRPTALEILGDKNSESRRMLSENIICERLRTGEVTATDIKLKIKKHISKGFKPDLVIIDYFECIAPERTSSIGDNEWSKEGVTMRKLESVADELNIALWVPVQGTKDSIGAEIVGVHNAGGSVKKTQIGHVVITLAQTMQMKEEGKINLFIGKLRAAKIGRTAFEGVKFNNGTCRLDFSEVDSSPFIQPKDNNLLQGIANAIR